MLDAISIQVMVEQGITKITTALPLAALAFKVARNRNWHFFMVQVLKFRKLEPSLESFRRGKVFNQPLTHTRKE